MKNILSLIIFLINILPNTLSAEDCFGTSCLNNEIRNNCTQDFREGCINWNSRTIYAVGLGVPNTKFKSEAQRNYSARVAAEQVAMRNLLMMIQSVNISSETTVKDGMLESDSIRSKIQGSIKQIQPVGAPRYMSDGSVAVTMSMRLGKVVEVLSSDPGRGEFQVPKEIEGPKVVGSKNTSTSNSSTGSSTGGVYTGLLIIAEGMSVSPALSPKILNEDGDVIYGYADVDREFVTEQGMMGYLKDRTAALENDRIRGNPLELRALRTSGNHKADIVITNADGNLLKQLNRTQTFLREARVIILLK